MTPLIIVMTVEYLGIKTKSVPRQALGGAQRDVWRPAARLGEGRRHPLLRLFLLFTLIFIVVTVMGFWVCADILNFVGLLSSELHDAMNQNYLYFFI